MEGSESFRRNKRARRTEARCSLRGVKEYPAEAA
jgi:hypothetical protein